MLKAISHVGLTVSDIERSVAWYRDVVGLDLVVRQRQENVYTRELVGVPGAVLEVAEFRVSCGAAGKQDVMLELIQYVEPEGETLDRRPYDVGTAHISFVVSDIERAYEELMRGGVTFVSSPVAITAGINKGGYVCYFKDPDGITLELFEPPPAKTSLDRGRRRNSTAERRR